ncbi:MAG: XylR family transcriptional regulator [Planctomyces sp.]|uniref:Transcriptional regulator, AraC family n=1 Tax=Rubinisphaera brasiliensis (strain ATCC 49424 / DSM 5305 / JCM 21570 / IAM 15109 / NBRC 103401 / IFAM 1448) TaxID=756272 RepID=F0SJN0_RUBBR|nr:MULTISPECIES: DNA-binding transcriptional regulator [Rubinisphaera]ADY61868.1 transcriptional regulator, AraC family [Rubinisphaera brasiliensis DSM 5305]MBB02090.1 XylR family transcriptional regulator [Planctomyces sp.]
MSRRKSVALLIETSNSYARGLLEGITAYVTHHESWSIYLPEQERGAHPPKWLENWKGDGIIARVETDEIATAIRNTRLPVVDVSAARYLPDIPWVETNDLAIAQMAADHLLERGFQNLAFCGDPGFNWSNWRQKYFAQLIEESGRQYFPYDSIPRNHSDYSWRAEQHELVKWIKSLPRPIGIFACYDIKARAVLDACRELDLAVPEEIAVLGVDDDQLLCQLAVPRLSSIRCNSHRAGFVAAQLLDRMMNGEQVPADPVLVDPLEISTRQSTDTLAINDPDIAQAVRFIRENAFEGINVSDVLHEVALSRRVLEHRFQKILGRSPHQEIVRVKMARIKCLLVETDLTLSDIAHRCGFQNEEYLSVSFKKEVGIPPGRYRRDKAALE